MKILIAATVYALASFSAQAAAPAKAPVCAGCHGAAGVAAIPGYPNLAGQNEQYLVSSLNSYKNKQRNGGLAVVMHAQAAALSDAEIAELAKYYSSME